MLVVKHRYIILYEYHHLIMTIFNKCKPSNISGRVTNVNNILKTVVYNCKFR